MGIQTYLQEAQSSSHKDENTTPCTVGPRNARLDPLQTGVRRETSPDRPRKPVEFNSSTKMGRPMKSSGQPNVLVGIPHT